MNREIAFPNKGVRLVNSGHCLKKLSLVVITKLSATLSLHQKQNTIVTGLSRY
jgi:hypothetical protein